jgi:hypothetical protein
VTLSTALEIALAAYDEDEAEREALLDALVPLLFDREMLRNALEWAWTSRADEIREALTAYQVERAEIDAEAAADEGLS